MKLLALTTEHVQGLPDRQYSFSDRGIPHGVFLVTGRQGAGKTRLLDVIAVAAQVVGPGGAVPQLAGLLRKGERRGHIAARWFIDPADRGEDGTEFLDVAFAFNPGGIERPIDARQRGAFRAAQGRGKIAYFSSERRLEVHRRRPRPPMPVAPRATMVARDYDGARAFFLSLAELQTASTSKVLEETGVVTREDAPDLFAPVKRSIGALLPDLRLIGVGKEEDVPLVRFRRRDGVTVELDELSDGERQAVLFAILFQRDALNGSIVLVDVPELHVHPTEQVAAFGRLLELGSGNQIIAATRSTELLRTARPDQVLDLSSLKT